jgi:hypothetical protein
MKEYYSPGKTQSLRNKIATFAQYPMETISEAFERFNEYIRVVPHCWRIKDVSTYDPQAYGPTPFSPRDSQGSCLSVEQRDYKRSIYLYSLTTQTLTMIRLENYYTTLETTIKLTR